MLKFQKKTKITLVICILILIILAIGFWPIYLDSHPKISLRIYAGYLTREKIKISSLFKEAKIVCAIGPYDSFNDARFRVQLNQEQIISAEKILVKKNEKSLGGNNFFLIGLNNDQAIYFYDSKFFINMVKKQPSENAPDCITSQGVIYAEKIGNTIAIRLGR